MKFKHVRPRLHVIDVLNVYCLASNFRMSFRCLWNYPPHKFYCSKVEARSPLSQAPLQLVWRRWPHDENASIVNSDSQKHDVKKEILMGSIMLRATEKHPAIALSNDREILYMRVEKGQIIQRYRAEA